jgi:hypothetical protein
MDPIWFAASNTVNQGYIGKKKRPASWFLPAAPM